MKIFIFKVFSSNESEQSFVMYYLAMIPWTRKMLRCLVFFAAENVYVNNWRGNPNYIRSCDQSAIKLFKSTAITLAAISIFAALYFGFPFFTYISRNELQFPVPVLFPFTDIETPNGIAINILSQLFMTYFGATGNIVIEIIQIIFKNTVWAITVAICHSVDEFSMAIENLDSTPTSRRFIDYSFRNILVQIQDLDRYILL